MPIRFNQYTATHRLHKYTSSYKATFKFINLAGLDDDLFVFWFNVAWSQNTLWRHKVGDPINQKCVILDIAKRDKEKSLMKQIWRSQRNKCTRKKSLFSRDNLERMMFKRIRQDALILLKLSLIWVLWIFILEYAKYRVNWLTAKDSKKTIIKTAKKWHIIHTLKLSFNAEKYFPASTKNVPHLILLLTCTVIYYTLISSVDLTEHFTILSLKIRRPTFLYAIDIR